MHSMDKSARVCATAFQKIPSMISSGRISETERVLAGLNFVYCSVRHPSIISPINLIESGNRTPVALFSSKM